jgi:hypothetical protein
VTSTAATVSSYRPASINACGIIRTATSVFRWPSTLILRGAPKLFECPPLAYSGLADQELVQELQDRILVKTLGKSASGQKETHLDFQP